MSINNNHNHNNIIYINRLGKKVPTLETKFLGTIVSQKKISIQIGTSTSREPLYILISNTTAANSTSSSAVPTTGVARRSGQIRPYDRRRTRDILGVLTFYRVLLSHN